MLDGRDISSRFLQDDAGARIVPGAETVFEKAVAFAACRVADLKGGGTETAEIPAEGKQSGDGPNIFIVKLLIIESGSRTDDRVCQRLFGDMDRSAVEKGALPSDRCVQFV